MKRALHDTRFYVAVERALDGASHTMSLCDARTIAECEIFGTVPHSGTDITQEGLITDYGLSAQGAHLIILDREQSRIEARRKVLGVRSNDAAHSKD